MSGAGEGNGPGTRVVGAGRRPEWTQRIVNPPVWRASTILYDSVAQLRGTGARDTHHRLFYGRRGTPTQWSLADALTALEPGAEGTLLYPSGVAAISTALLAVLSPGDELLLVDSAYDPTRNLAKGLLKRFGITTMQAEDESRVTGLTHIDRGYERFAEKLRALGADIERISAG